MDLHLPDEDYATWAATHPGAADALERLLQAPPVPPVTPTPLPPWAAASVMGS